MVQVDWTLVKEARNDGHPDFASSFGGRKMTVSRRRVKLKPDVADQQGWKSKAMHSHDWASGYT